MPLYPVRNPSTGEIQDIFFHMDDDKKYIDNSGVEWIREYNSPQLNTQGSIDPWNNADFVNKTNKEGTIGDLLDRSADLSRQRADQNGGVDPIKEKYYDNYSKTRKGSKHPDKMPKTFEDKNIKIELD